MKKSIIISAILLLLPITLRAQKKDYTSEQIRAAYEGTWKYENKKTQEEFVLKLFYKPSLMFDDKNPLPCFIGYYSYSKNGKVVDDNLNLESEYSAFATMDEIGEQDFTMIPIHGSVGWEKGFAAFYLYDKLLGKIQPFFTVSVKTMNASNTHLYWDMTKTPDFLKDQSSGCSLSKEKEGCTIPMKMTLTRVK